MNIQLYLIITIILALYLAANYYIGWRGWQALKMNFSQIRGGCYLLIISMLSVSYPLSRLGEALLSTTMIDNLTLVGSYWLGMLYYLFIFTLLLDLLRALNKRWPFISPKILRHSPFIVMILFLGVLALITYGAWNARHPVTMNYEITIPKTVGSLQTLQVVLVSDIHLGTLIDNRRLTKLVNRINQLEPDIVLFAGDIIDDKVQILINQPMIENLTRLRPKLGTYAILGNHEYFDQKPDVVIGYLEQGDVHVLRDHWLLIADSFYLVGRDDLSKERYTGTKRQDLASIMTGIDHTLPIILLDHQPNHLQDGIQQGVDLQLSGHTHLGQFFPNNLLTDKLYEVDWGYLRKESMQIIVSCGFGTWGPPIRIGNQPEIVNITIHFKKPEN